MKKLIIVLSIIAVALILFLVTGPFYIMNEWEQAVVLRFGRIVNVQSTSGLKIKTPFLDEVNKYPKMIMPWDGETQRLQTKENQFIWVDATARWRISDPVKFYESIGSLEGAYKKLDDVIDSAVRTVISSNYLKEAVRDTNEILSSSNLETFQTGDKEGSATLAKLTQTQSSYEAIDMGRSKLFNQMLSNVTPLMPQFGLEVLDIIPRQIKYSDELTESVFNRMIKERNQIAQAFRSYGEGKKAELMGQLENQKRKYLSEAYATSETIKGKADAEAAGIYSKAYNVDPGFFQFWRAMESYRQTMPNFSKTLSTDLDYFRYFMSSTGR